MTESTPLWQGKKGPIAPADMPTPHLKSAINVVEKEIKDGITKGAGILEHLKAELSGRKDA